MIVFASTLIALNCDKSGRVLSAKARARLRWSRPVSVANDELIAAIIGSSYGANG